jgi:hypothetical protein
MRSYDGAFGQTLLAKGELVGLNISHQELKRIPPSA